METSDDTRRQNLHPSQLLTDYWYQGRFSIAEWGNTVMGAAALVLTGFMPSYEMKAATVAIATGNLMLSRQFSNATDRTRSRFNDAEAISDVGYNQHLFRTLVQPPGLESGNVQAPAIQTWRPDPKKDVIDILDLVNPQTRHLYPHIMVIGGTGDGKTTLAEWLNDNQQGKVHKLYISPTADDKEFIDYLKFGCGIRNGKVVALDFPSITEVLNYLVQETVARYQMPRSARQHRGQVDAIIDEFRLTAKVGAMLEQTIGRIPTPDGGSVDANYSQLVAFLATVSRKVDIRLWLLTQSDRVKSLNLEGEGDLRQSFTAIRLRSHARQHLQTLIQQGRFPQESLIWFDNCPDRSVCMVDDRFAILPTEYLKAYRDSKANSLGWTPPVVESAAVPPMQFPSKGDTPLITNEVLASPDDNLGTPSDPQTQLQDETTLQFPSPVAPAPSQEISPENLHGQFSKEELLTFQKFLDVSEDVGFVKTKILQAAGFGGRKYKEGNALWERFVKFRETM